MTEKQDMGVATQADRELFKSLIAADELLADRIDRGLAYTGEVASIAAHRLASQADQGEVVARLKLDIAAQECLQDSAYKAGLKHGWNLCAAEDEEGYQKAANGTEHIAELKRIRAARQALATHPQPSQKGEGDE